MSSEERFYWLFFSAFEEGIGPVRFQLLINRFQKAKNAWGANRRDLIEAGIAPSVTDKFIRFRDSFDQEKYLKIISDSRIGFLTSRDKQYPPLLKQISDAPFVLYILGNYRTEWFKNDSKIGIVGTRKMTGYGEEVTKKMTEKLVEAGLTIVSGMALGVDTVAHQTALRIRGKTVAVLGCGLNLIYPPQNSRLYREISESGCLISEMPVNHWVSKAVFPARNRIISGLCRGVLITEGAINSGALITCSYAAEQGRDVFAVPGPVNSFLSAGPHSLLKKGARLVTEAKDILEEWNIMPRRVASIPPPRWKGGYTSGAVEFDEKEKIIIGILEQEQLTVDDIIKKSHFSSSSVLSALSFLEIKGYIREYRGKYRINY